MFNIRTSLRKILLKLLRWTEKDAPQQTILRNRGQNFWQKEIQISSSLVALFCILALLVVLILGIGISLDKIFGILLFIAIISVFIILYLKRENPELLDDSEAIMLLGLIVISSVLLMQVFKDLPIVFPIAAFTVLTGLLLSERLAMIVGIILSLIFSVINGFSMEFFFIHLCGSIAGVMGIRSVRNRSSLVNLGIKIIIVNISAILLIHLLGSWEINVLERNLFFGIINGLFSSLVVLGVLPYLEAFFSRTTSIKLLELTDFTQPLLKRLIIEAPGTYHHSLIMASLAEQAAGAIGANTLLARVGAYYHDIGKLSNPDYFIENQVTTGNPHDPLSPTMSSLIVISHVKEGVALAKQYKLDKVILDCIEQHHGTSIIHYFYHRALEQVADINQENFRYSGPKPHTKVAAILMLADSSEAACRTLEDVTPGRIKDVVEKIINNKFIDGQFTECPITLHDLSMIAESLVVSLSGIYHARIEYEDEKK